MPSAPKRSAALIVLSIVDSWGLEDERRHLAALQEKLNAYFGFVESGQIYESYPDAVGKPLRIDIIGRAPIPPAGLAFLEKASVVASRLQISITHRRVRQTHADISWG
jgi:hypothetical protein